MMLYPLPATMDFYTVTTDDCIGYIRHMLVTVSNSIHDMVHNDKSVYAIIVIALFGQFVHLSKK